MGPHVILHVRRYTLVLLFKGHPICYVYFMLDQSSFAQVQVTGGKRVFPFEQQLSGLSCSSSDHLLRPWRSRASKTHPFWGLLLDSSEVLIRRITSGIWLAEATCPTRVLVGISTEWAPKLCRQIGTLEDCRCSLP